jgi:hypothetical protein
MALDNVLLAIRSHMLKLELMAMTIHRVNQGRVNLVVGVVQACLHVLTVATLVVGRSLQAFTHASLRLANRALASMDLRLNSHTSFCVRSSLRMKVQNEVTSPYFYFRVAVLKGLDLQPNP